VSFFDIVAWFAIGWVMADFIRFLKGVWEK
jgi:hypothetical protein